MLAQTLRGFSWWLVGPVVWQHITAKACEWRGLFSSWKLGNRGKRHQGPNTPSCTPTNNLTSFLWSPPCKPCNSTTCWWPRNWHMGLWGHLNSKPGRIFFSVEAIINPMETMNKSKLILLRLCSKSYTLMYWVQCQDWEGSSKHAFRQFLFMDKGI